MRQAVQQKDYGSMSIPEEDGVHTRVLTVPKRIRNQKISAHTSGRLIVVTINDFHPTLKALHQTTGHGKERIMLHKVLIRLMAAVEGISYLEAEVLIQVSCQQKICS